MKPEADRIQPEAAPPAAADTPAAGALSGFLRRHRWLWWVAWAVAVACLVGFLRTIDLRATGRELAQARPLWVIVAMLANFATLPIMLVQWLRLRPKGTCTRPAAMWECVSVGMAGMNTLPFGGGHAMTIGLLATRITGLQGAVSLLALEQIAEGVGKIALLLAALAVAPLPPILQRAIWVLAAATVVGFLALMWVARHPPSHVVSTSWRARWGQHLEVLRRPGAFLVAAGLSIVIKVVAVLAIYAVQRSIGVHLPFSDSILVLVAVVFATLMAVSPGNVGVYELAAITTYELLGVPHGEAAALALVQHVCFLVPIVGPGFGLLLWRAVKLARRRSAA